jgi:hypothetical protein
MLRCEGTGPDRSDLVSFGCDDELSERRLSLLVEAQDSCNPE